MTFVCGACGQGYDRAGFCAVDGHPLVVPTDPMIGREIGRYRIARLLGQGGMGQVYLGVQPSIGSRVAIKILSNECTRIPDLLERFFAEARAVNMIRHESIVSVIDLAQLDDGRPYIVMEFVEGQTLGAIVRAGIPPIGGLVQAMTEVLSALGAAHALGIVHRDLKPDNILITIEGHAKVLDFGIAKLAPGLSNVLSPRTRTGALLGTPAYMAPEQIRGAGNVDARTDVYAAGIVLFEATTGRVPFRGDTLYDLMQAHLEQVPPSLRALRPEIPAALEDVILQALAKDPAHRFQSAAAMTQAMHEAARHLPPDQWRLLSSRREMARPSFEHMEYVTPIGSGGLAKTAHASAVIEKPRTRDDAPQAVQAPPRTGRRWIVLAALAAIGAVGIALAVRQAPDDSRMTMTQVTAAPVLPLAAPSVQVPPPTTPPAPPTSAPATSAPTTNAPTTNAPTTSSPTSIAPTTNAPTTNTPAGNAASMTNAPSGHVPRPHGGAPTPGAPTPGVMAPSASNGGPTIIGGGSAADHGVHIGPGVQIGSGVTIGAHTAPTAGLPAPFTRTADYNGKKFDAAAYAPRALALAKTLYPDAALVRYDIAGVFSNGLADVALTDDRTTYWFRSPAHSVRAAGLPKNVDADLPCYVEVEVHGREVEARVLSLSSMDSNCVKPVRRLPTCTLAQVWAKAKADGADPDTVAKIGFLADGQWFFDNQNDGHGITRSYADTCP